MTCTEEDSLIRISESNVADWQPFGTHIQNGVPPKDKNDLRAYTEIMSTVRRFEK